MARGPEICQLLAEEGDAFTFVRPPFRGQSALQTAALVATDFDVTYSGFGSFPQAQAAFQAAVDIWRGLVTTPVTIRVQANFVPLGAGVLGSAGAGHVWRNFAGAPVANRWYNDAVADRLSGTDLAGEGTFDIVANFNSNFSSWYFGTDGATPSGKYDFVSVVLHELGHGLGFSGSASVVSGVGRIEVSSTGFPKIYDHFTVTETGAPMLGFPNPSAELGTRLTQPFQSGNPHGPGVYWNGPAGVAGNGGSTARLYTPATWASGSSYSHLDDQVYLAGNQNSLMTHQLSQAEAIHNPGPVTLGLFADIGWNNQEPELIQNGDFSGGMTGWAQFATPDLSYIVSTLSGGVFHYFRQPPPPGTTNQAVIFQETGAALQEGSPIAAEFDLGNSSSVRKRISVLIVDADFSDLSMCTFWLAPNAPMRTYAMRTHTTELWTNAAIYFYAASVGSNGGYYQLDNVSMRSAPSLSSARTDCVDPTVPAAGSGSSSATLLANGDFSAGLPPWGTFGQITHQVSSGVFEFIRPPGTPAGVLLQPTGATMATGEIMRADFQLGNSSGVRKRATVLLHDNDFSDLAACTFWLAPGQPLSAYSMRAFATKPWSNATLSIYPSTVGLSTWMRFDNATLQRTPSLAIYGAECIEPGGESLRTAPTAVSAVEKNAPGGN